MTSWAVTGAGLEGESIHEDRWIPSTPPATCYFSAGDFETAFDNDHEFLLAEIHEHRLDISKWDLRSGRKIDDWRITGPNGSKYRRRSFSVSPGAKFVATVFGETLQVYMRESRELVGECRLSGLDVDKLGIHADTEFSLDGTELAAFFPTPSPEDPHYLVVWDFSSGDVVFSSQQTRALEARTTPGSD